MKSLDREIIYCDNHLLVVFKKGGELVQPFLHEQMRLWIQNHFAKKGAAFLEPVHRLDKPVAGLVLFARTTKALQRLNTALQRREICKTYLARVEGWVKEPEATLQHFLIHGNFRAEVSSRECMEAKEALLSYKVVERGQKESLLEVELKTGRYHQIRAQLSAIGHPIIGDRKYGSCSSLDTIALEHVKLAFYHPVTCDYLELRRN